MIARRAAAKDLAATVALVRRSQTLQESPLQFADRGEHTA
jgi:hypothetical protein